MKRVLKIVIAGVYLLMSGIYLNNWIKPTQFYFLSFLGLGYVFIFLVFILALWIAYYLSKRMFFTGLILLVAGIKIHLNFFSFAVPNEAEGDKSLKVLTYNVRLFDLYTDPAGSVKQQIFDYLKEQKADIYCFQEFYQQDPPTKFVTRDSLVKILGTPNVHEHYSFRYKARQFFGVAMMTHFPVIARGDVSFADEEHDDHNYCIYMDVVPSEGDTLRVYNVHLQSVKLNNKDLAGIENQTRLPSQNNLKGTFDKLHLAFEKRQVQTDKILAHIAESPYRVIIAGDFNDTPVSYSYLQFRKLLKDAFTSNRTGIGATYAGKLPVGRIDYILHSEVLHPYDFNIQQEALSDHYAISCRFNF